MKNDTKHQIIFRLLHEQHITPEEAETLMEDIEWWDHGSGTSNPLIVFNEIPCPTKEQNDRFKRDIDELMNVIPR